MRSVLTSVMLLTVCCALWGQNPQLQTRNGRQFPTVVFSSVLWTANPVYYSIAVDSSGTATYQSVPETVGRTGVRYTVEFHVSDKTRRVIFNLIRSLGFFRQMTMPEISAEDGIVRTIGYYDTGVSNEITYRNASDPDVQEITSVFEETSNTLECGRRLISLHAHDRNALGSELRSMQAGLERHHLRELQALIPVLDRLVQDHTLDARIRQSAEALLTRAR